MPVTDHSVAAPSGPAAGRSLENTANKVSPSEGPQRSDLPVVPNVPVQKDRTEKRRDRFATRAVLWRASSLQRCRQCGRVPRSDAAPVTIRLREAIAGYAGLQHCGSVHSCPVCSATILVGRALEIGAVLAQAVAEGHVLAFGTFTMSHRSHEPLKGLWDAAGAAWRRSISGKGWVTVKGPHGVVGWVRVWEVTDGRNGWHVHVHFVVVLAPGSTAADLEAVAGGMFSRWTAGLVAAGREAPRLIGQDWHLATGEAASSDLAGYLFKVAGQAHGQDQGAALGLELTHTHSGRARSDLATKPIWSILDRLVRTGEVDAMRRWHEWEAGSKGRRQVGWSTGLRERFAPTIEEVTDDEIVEREMGSAEDDVVALTRAGWDRLVSMPYLLPMMLDAVERGGLDELRQRLDFADIEYTVVR